MAMMQGFHAMNIAAPLGKPVLLPSTLTKVIISKAEEQGPVGDSSQRF